MGRAWIFEGNKMKVNHGIQMTEEELNEHTQAFIDIEDSIELVMKNGVDL